ncbi:type II secretion system protein GspM, partial [Escherichia coli]
MIKSWWAEKSTSEKQIVAALAVLSLGVFCWLGVIKPIDTYIAEHQSHAQKIKKDIKCGFAPIFPDICYHLTHYKPAAADIPVASDNP